MLTSTTPMVEGRPVRDYRGVVTGEAIPGVHFVGEGTPVREGQPMIAASGRQS